MIANIRNFGNMDMNDANRELKENLKAVKSQAEALEHGMDLMIRRIDFEPEEIGKWEALRKALVDFRTIEVNPNIAQNVMISVENMDKLNEVYGAYTEPAINKIINDLIVEADKKFQDKHKSRFKKAMDKIEAPAESKN